MFSGRCSRRLHRRQPELNELRCCAARSWSAQPDQQRRTSEACFVRGTVVRGCARGHVGWQKLSGGVGLRRSLLVAAESETWGLAPSGKPQRANGRRESALNALRSEWRKGSNEPPGDGRRFGSSKSSPFYGVAGGAALIERAEQAPNAGEARAVTGRQSLILGQCDGKRTPAEIARRLQRSGSSGVKRTVHRRRPGLPGKRCRSATRRTGALL